jgi:hypothetical protein
VVAFLRRTVSVEVSRHFSSRFTRSREGSGRSHSTAIGSKPGAAHVPHEGTQREQASTPSGQKPKVVGPSVADWNAASARLS